MKRTYSISPPDIYPDEPVVSLTQRMVIDLGGVNTPTAAAMAGLGIVYIDDLIRFIDGGGALTGLKGVGPKTAEKIHAEVDAIRRAAL